MAKLLSGTRVYGNASIDANLAISGTTVSTSNSTGALIVSGGVGITGNVFLSSANNFYSTTTGTSYFLGWTDNYFYRDDRYAGVTFGGGYFNITPQLISSSTLSIRGTVNNDLGNNTVIFAGRSPVLIQNSTTSTSTTTGALRVSGGLGVSGNVYADAIYDGGVELITYIGGVDATQNTRIDSADSLARNAYGVANVSVGIDATQNTNILNTNSIAQGAYNVANLAFTGLITANQNTAILFGIQTTQNTNIASADTLARNSYGVANLAFSGLITANQNTAILFGIQTTQNTRISSADALATGAYTKANDATTLAQAAFNKANTGGGTGTGNANTSGWLPNAVIFSNTTGYLSNTNGISFYTSNNTLVVSNVSVPTVYTTSGGIVFPDGTTQATAAAGAATDQLARNLANTKTFTFYTNSAPATSNAHDLWVNSDTGVVYENFGNTSNPVWAEFGPTGVASNTAPGIINATQVQINGNVAVNGPAFSAYANNSLQTITSGSQQKILFQVEEFDTNNCFSNSRFTPTIPGYYQLNAEVRFDGAMGTGETMVVVWKNGSEYKRGWNASGTQWASNFWGMTVSTLVYANGTTDYFEIYAQQTSGGNLTVTAVNNPAITWFNGCMVRGA
jgi:uncharacterized protein YaaQ